MNKRVIAIVITVFTLVSALASFGCSGGKDKPAVPASEVYADVLKVSGFGTMTAVPARDYNEIYGVDDSKIAESAWYMSDNPSLNADEVAIFLLSDASYAAELAKLLEGRIARQTQVAESYSPDEAGKLRQARVVTASNSAGTWVYYCIGSEYSKMMEVLKTDIG